MKPELRARIIAYNRKTAQQAEMAGDLEVIVAQFRKLPPGQLKTVLTKEVLLVLSKYGIRLE